MPGSAIFLEADGKLLLQNIEEKYQPVGSQSLVQVEYSAVNPADVRHSFMGLYGSVAGYEWVGKVVEVGEESPFSIGQRVFGMTMPGAQRPRSTGAHQDYLIAESYMTWSCPSDLKETAAVVMPAGYQTAADTLFNMLGFGFNQVNIDGDDASNVPILIWGGASYVGVQTIQTAKLAGFNPIITTASKKNHETLKQYGATACFDYRDPDVVQNIRDYVRNTGIELKTVVDAVGVGLGVFEPASDAPKSDPLLSTPSLARSCCSNADSDDLRLCGVLPVAHDPLWKFCIGVRPHGDDVVGFPQDPTWPQRVEKFMAWLVSNHQLVKPFPNVSIVQGGEESIQRIYDVFEGKVSMEKVLIQHPIET